MLLQNVKPISRKQAENFFASKDPKKICTALVSLSYYDSDWRWVQEKCLSYLKNENEDVKGLAVTCLGHLARIHHKLDLDKVMPLLEKMLDDPQIAGQVGDTLDDIKMFVDIKFGKLG